jgi:predicted negative regulator of RcsB-dependent stress response
MLGGLLVVGASAAGYWYWSHRSTETDVSQLYNHINQLVNEKSAENPDWLDRKLARAEQLIEQDEQDEAYALLEDIEQHLEND